MTINTNEITNPHTLSTLGIDVRSCGRFSPNIEVSCMHNVFNTASAHLHSLTLESHTVNEAKAALFSAYQNYLQRNAENNHDIDEDKRAKENSFMHSVENAGKVIIETKQAEEQAAREAQEKLAALKADEEESNQWAEDSDAFNHIHFDKQESGSGSHAFHEKQHSEEETINYETQYYN